MGAKISPRLVVVMDIAEALSQRDRDSSIFKCS
jgi:hypothetical protein